MDENKLQKLKEMMSLLNEGLTKTDFNKTVESVMKIIIQMEKRNQAAIAQLQQQHAAFMQNEKGSHEMTLSNMKKQVNQVFVGERLAEMRQMIDEMVKSSMEKMHGKMMEVDSKMMKVKDGYTPQKGKDYFDGKHGNILTPDEVRDKLESIQEEEQKLAISAIAHLEEKLKDLEKKAGMSRGSVGGFNYGSLSLHIVDDETPVGTINGSNTTFTVNNPPSPVSSLKVYLNGQRMRITEDYTFSGSTITFLTAPPTTSILLVDYRI